MQINKKHISIFIVIVFVIVAVIMLTNTQQKPLPGYNGAKDEVTTEETTTQPIATFSYTDEKTGFTFSVPEDWQKVIKDGYTTFIHSPSATGVQVQTMDYYPQINMLDETTLSAELTAAGMQFMNFYWIDNSSYVLMYQSASDPVTDYIEVCYYDRANVVKLVYSVYDEYYERLKYDIAVSMESVVWDKADPIPETMVLNYSEVGDFEYAVPLNWQSGITDGAFYTSDPTTGASYTISVTESTASYADATELQYANYAAIGRNNFLLKSYTSDERIISATATYNANGTYMMFRQYMIANGDYEYCITEECPNDTYEAVAVIFDDVIRVFRIFSSYIPVSDRETTVAETESFAGNTSETVAETSFNVSGAAETQLSTEQETEAVTAIQETATASSENQETVAETHLVN